MKQLTLSIKRQPFDEILAGTKKSEYRNVWPTQEKRLLEGYRVGDKIYASIFDIEITDEGTYVEEIIPRHYDTLKLYTGAYSGKRPYMVVEVKEIYVRDILDENGEPITLDIDDHDFFALCIEYVLGNILEVNLNPT